MNNPLISIDVDGHDGCSIEGMETNCSSLTESAARENADEAQQQAAQQQPSDTEKKPTKKPSRGGRRQSEPKGGPPKTIPLPNGKGGEVNEWEVKPPKPGDVYGDYAPVYGPKYPVAGDAGSQPRAWWDPDDGYWSSENGKGPRAHWDRWGNKLSTFAVTMAELAAMMRILSVLNDIDEIP